MAADPDVAAAGVAAFDFDGTLVRGDSLPVFLSLLLGRFGFAATLLRAGPAMIAAYRRDGRDAAKAELLYRALRGADRARIAAVGSEFAARLAGRIRRDMGARLAWHKSQGHTLVLVSASLAVYLEPFGRLTGFDRVIATELEAGTDGHLTGRLAGANVRARQKAIRLSALLPPRAEVWAYGNSAGDREMLAMADHPHTVGWGRRLAQSGA
jgi:phosphatidylglycerophosphatase C